MNIQYRRMEYPKALRKPAARRDRRRRADSYSARIRANDRAYILAAKRRDVGETLASIAKSYAVDLSMISRQRSEN
jgi:hypothetical protein